MRPFPFIACLSLFACGAPLPDQPASADRAGASASVEPSAPLDAIPAVCRLHVSPAPALAPGDVVLVQGELSRYYLGRIRDRDLPDTLLERIVPHLSWSDGDGVSIRPSVALEPGEHYALATPDDGLVAELTVDSAPRPRLSRWFPPPGAAGGTAHAVYCAAEPVSFEPVSAGLALEPGAIPLELRPGVDGRGTLGDRCLTLVAQAAVPPELELAPPLAAGGQVLDPAPLVGQEPRVPAPLACGEGQIPFGPACITVQDDRAVIQSFDDGALWSIVRHDEAFVAVVEPNARFVLDGLIPGASQTLDVELFDLHQNVWAGPFTLTTNPATSHVVINEVMANPLGPEPAQEWIELENDGSSVVDLAGFTLSDAGGSVELPSLPLGPGAFALLVRQDFVPDDGADVVPAEGVPLVRLPALGKNGLANSGEALELRRPDGSVASRFPASPKPKSGISIARRSPSSLDDDPSAFGPSAEPGASPGAANTLAEP